MSVRRTFAFALGGLSGFALAAAAGASARFYAGRRCADRVWAASRYPQLGSVGAVERLAILPLIDWYAASDDLATEPGVAYLVCADDTTILFDVGYNQGVEHPSPLLRNMAALGVDIADVDALVISHAHGDHQGGSSHMQDCTYALSGQPVDLKGIPAYVPVPLSNPTAQSIVVDAPRVIATGVASTGPIPRQLFFLGWTLEHSLAVNVKGKGIVLIVGCGHPTLQRIVDQAEMLFDEPIYGLVGGLHYPVTASREQLFGLLPAQRLMGTGKPPWDPISRQDVETAIAYLERRQPRLVALSPHDSCDWSLAAFRTTFGQAYQDLLVGEEIIIQ